MNVKEIRDKSNDELLKTLDESKKELFDLRFEKATGSIDNPMRIRELRNINAAKKKIRFPLPEGLYDETGIGSVRRKENTP